MVSEAKHRLAFIVPTRNRPELLGKLLRSLRVQTVPPHQVVIVDGSDEPIEDHISEFLSPTVSCVRVFPPGLTRQRNAGIAAVSEDITLVGYLDDDIVLEPDAVEQMLRFWEKAAPEVGGTSFHITNTEIAGRFVKLPGKILGRLFWCDGFTPGRVLRSGFQTMVAPVSEDTYSEWLCGGATVWRKPILDEFKYDEQFEGFSYTEDLDYSYVIGQRYQLVVLRDARVQHNPPPFEPRKNYSMGRMNVYQRYCFVRKHRELSVPLFIWATIGESLRLLLVSIPRRSSREIYKAAGNIVGLTDIIRGKTFQTSQAFRKQDQ